MTKLHVLTQTYHECFYFPLHIILDDSTNSIRVSYWGVLVVRLDARSSAADLRFRTNFPLDKRRACWRGTLFINIGQALPNILSTISFDLFQPRSISL